MPIANKSNKQVKGRERKEDLIKGLEDISKFLSQN